VPSRSQRQTVPARQSDVADDPGAVIDWLLNR